MAALTASLRAEGLLVERTGGGFVFSPAHQLEVNGKDRLLILGDQPQSATPVNKLPNTKIGSSLLADAASGVMVEKGARGAARRYVYPGGIDRKAAPPPKDAWKESTLTFKKAEKDKTPVTAPASRLVAFLAGGTAELAELCMDESSLLLLGGGQAEGAFTMQLELTSAAVAAFGSQPAMAGVERRVASFLQLRISRFDNGMESVKSLTEGLKMAELSAKAYPNEPAHRQARERLAAAKAWLDKRTAVLRALAAGEQWDAFLVAYRDFEKHEGSFADLAKLHRAALQASLDTHWKSGKERLGRAEYRRAWAELRTASLRQPSNNALQQEVAVAWSEHSRRAAVDRQGKRRQLTAGELEVIEQARVFADRFRQQGKLDEAMAKVAEAERIDPESLSLLLTKAEILGARGEFSKALATLDAFDLMAVDRERQAGNKLRTDLSFQLAERRAAIRKSLEADWQAGKYHAVGAAARKGLLTDERDPASLYFAGLAAMVTRQPAGGAGFLRRYLEVSDNLDADGAERMRVARLLTAAGAPTAQPAGSESGETHWFSGAPVPRGAFYCPLSLAFVPKVDRIAASNKLAVKFNWTGEGRLRSIVPAFEKGAAATGEKPLAFSYAPAVPHAFAVEAGEAPRQPSGEGPDAILAASNVLLPNNPLLDPAMVEKLNGKPVTVGVAGNRFFHPFVWERPYYFAFAYDERGRVKSARQLAGSEAGAGPPVVAEFEWNEMQLGAVRVYQSASADARGQLIYERTMQYQGDKLVGEQIRAGQKDGKIKYEWGAAGLASAECDKDETLDNRSREVFFVTAAAGGGKRGGK